MDKKKKKMDDQFQRLTEIARGTPPTTTIPKWQTALVYFFSYSIAYLLAVTVAALGMFGFAIALNQILDEEVFVTSGFGPYFVLGAAIMLLRLAWQGYSSKRA